MYRLIPTLLLFFVYSAQAGEVGYVHGQDHCFYFGAPDGWVADNESGRSDGAAFVFYPKNGSWARSEVVIYARTAKITDKQNPIRGQVKLTLNQFRSQYNSPNISAKIVGKIKARSGADGVIYQYDGDRFGNREMVVYFNGKKTVNFFVMTSRSIGALKKSRKALIQLAQTYREANDCKPCTQREAAPCRVTTADEVRFKQLRTRHEKSISTAAGKAYEIKSVKAFWGDGRFVQQCMSSSKNKVIQPMTFFYVIKKNGKLRELAITPRNKITACIEKNVINRLFPKPPGEFVGMIVLKVR